MMLSKISLRNACRQARDYLVYFVTIVMVTALMYAFNGLIFSDEIQSLSKSLNSITVTIILASIVVVCVISWLVSYTTKFMLTRRSRELGTYILIGLENGQAARLFFLENLAVGGVAMGLGMLLGNLIFQVLRAVILAMFDIPYYFSFTFSLRTVGLTMVYFVLIYLSVQLKIRKRIRKMKIYDLICFERQNEEAAIQSSRRRRKLFGASIALGVAGTALIMMGDPLLGILGAACIIFFLYGFFASFSSGVPAWFEKHGARKYQGQNLMVFRSLCARLATMGVVMATISMLFTATLIAEGTGMIFRSIFCDRAALLSCFDLIFSAGDLGAGGASKCMDYIHANIPVRDSWQYPVYLRDTDEITGYIAANTEYYRCYPQDTVMRASDYKALRRMLGYQEVSLEPGQYLIHCQPYVEKALKGWDKPVEMGGYRLTPGGIYTETFAQHLWRINGQGFILVVPDEAAQSCAVSHHIYAAKTAERVSQEQYQGLSDMLNESSYTINYLDYDDIFLFVKSISDADVASMTAIWVLPLFYLAMVLTMTAATILTIRQLDEAERCRRQYELLHKLGMDRREMERALRTQFAIYYAMPAIPPLLTGVPFILHLAGLVEPGVLEGASRPVGIMGTAVGLFLLIYAVYILMAYTVLRRSVLPGQEHGY